ncbi:Serine/threonine-protein kinase HAL4/SAT4 [Fusarium oxysporum f. sp. albedinis]|nr:Serine/threonine-protein kinase HAL4/SAT4 [Fusarium oxysporum f. sp. albedinis]
MASLSIRIVQSDRQLTCASPYPSPSAKYSIVSADPECAACLTLPLPLAGALCGISLEPLDDAVVLQF